MATETSIGDVSLIQDEDVLRKMWQETEDFGKKKEIRSHMYKIREARLKDFYTAGEESNTSSESRQHSTITTKSSSSNTGVKGSDSTTLADNLIDHSFLSLKSKEIRDSESPTKDSYKITETKKIDDKDWNVVECNESSKDGKTHTTTRMATTSGRQNVDGGEMNYAAKSEQKATVYKDGDDRNFTKAVGASSQNVIKQEASGGDDNSKFYSSSTTTSSSSKYTSEQRATTGDGIDYEPANVRVKDEHRSAVQQQDRPSSSSVRSSQTVVRKEYSDNIPNEFKNHPSYIDGNTKVTTETKTLPDGSTVTTTRYETKGATKFSSSSSTTSSSAKHVSSNEQQTQHFLTEDSGRYIDNRQNDSKRGDVSTSTVEIVKNQHIDSKTDLDKRDSSRISRNQTVEERYITESDIKRSNDLSLIGRDVKNVQNVDIVVKTRDIPIQETHTITTTTIKKSDGTTHDDKQIKSKNVTATTNIDRQTIPVQEKQVITTLTKNINNKYDNQRIVSDDFLNTEREHVEITQNVPKQRHSETIEIEFVKPKQTPLQQEPVFRNVQKPVETIEIEIIPKESFRKPEEPKYEQPERRTPINPGKSEWDEKPSPTEGQYDTTYRTDYVPRRISVEVSPTHDAFARSLRSISPDRISKTGSTRSLRTTSITSLRGTNSPERPNKHRASPVNSRPISPTKKSSRSPEKITDMPSRPRYESPEKITSHVVDSERMTKSASNTYYNTDTITRRNKINTTKTETDSSTLTKKKERIEKPRSRSVSPTSTASDIEFFRHRSDIVTDLDVDETNKNRFESTKISDTRPSTLNISPSKKPQRVTEKSSTSPLTDLKKTPTSPLKSRSPTKEPTGQGVRAKPKAIRRTDTYEERCREILGITDGKDTPRKASLPNTPRERFQSPTKQSPSKPKDKHLDEFPSQIRKSPEKKLTETYPEKPKQTKQKPSVQEFPAQIRKSPQKEPLEPYPTKPLGTKNSPSVQEFPAQIRKSTQKEPLEPYPEKRKGPKHTPSVQEFPSQIRKSPQKQPLEPYSQKPKDDKHTPTVQEFPAQVRKSPQKEPLEPRLEKPRSDKHIPSVKEFPGQIRKSPQKEPVQLHQEKPKLHKLTPSVQEFPAQIRKSPEKEPLEPYPEKPKDNKHAPSVQEFPAQIRKSPQREPLEPYQEKPKGDKYTPTVQEFPSQIKRSPEKEPLEPYPEKLRDTKQAPSVQEFPSQIRKSPEKQPLEFEEIPRRTKQIPGQFRQSPERVLTDIFDRPLEKTPNKVSLDDLPSIKTEKISLDDIPSVVTLEKQKPQRKISLSDLDVKPDRIIDDFLSNEKLDTEVTLEKYRTESIHAPSGIPTTQTIQTDTAKTTKKKSKDTKKTKKVTNLDSDTETSSEEEENMEEQIIEDLMDVLECEDRRTIENETTQSEVKKTQYQTTTEIRDLKDDSKRTTQCKPKVKPQKPKEADVEDFITVSKTQLLQSSSKMPVEEVVHTEKFMSMLHKEEEEDRKTRMKTTLTEQKEGRTDIILDNEALKSRKIVKKDSPDKKFVDKTPDKKKQTDLLIKKEKADTSRKVNAETKRTEIKITPKDVIKKAPLKTSTETNQQIKKSSITKKTSDEKKLYETEYTDQYCTTAKDKKPVNKVPSRVTAKITLTPVDRAPTKKNVQESITVNVEKIQKIEVVPKRPSSDTVVKSKITKVKVPENKQPRTITRTAVQKTVEIQPVRRHVVSTIINIKPKLKPETISKTIHKTTATKTILAPKTITKIQPKDSKLKKKPIQNGHVSTDEDSDVEIINTASLREPIKPDTYTRKSLHKKSTDSTARTRKCITTKSILIENAVADEREIIVDLKRSKSSREGTPDRICPYPVSSDADVGTPRYPDRILEPEDGTHRLKPKRISDIPLPEAENVTEFERITEVIEDTTKTAKTEVESADECLLSVNEKVSKFLSTAEQVTKKPMDMKPAPKVERPRLEVDESLKEDECLLSVSDKVNKFIATAEQLSSTTREMQAPKSPKYDVDESKPNEKSTPLEKVLDKTQITTTVETEKHMHIRKSVSPEKIEPSQRPKSRDAMSPKRSEMEPSKYKTPETSTDLYIKKNAGDNIRTRKEIQLEDTTPKTSRRFSKDEPKDVLSPTSRLRSTETIKRAKALFESIETERDIARHIDILSRPSVFEGRKLNKEQEVLEGRKGKDVRTKLTYDEVKRSPSPDKPRGKDTPRSDSPDKESPRYMAPLDRTIREHRKERTEEQIENEEHYRSRESSVDRDIPHYMLPLDRSVRERSPHKENLRQLEDIMHRSFGTDEVDVKTTKFGVTLKRTDSGRMISNRKSSVTSVDKQTEDLNIEEIYDLEYLEKLLETIVGYDVRRRIRAQIRQIKRTMEESTVEEVTRRTTPSKDSSRKPTEDSTYTRRISSTDRKKTSELTSQQDTTRVTEVSEYQSSYSSRRTSSEFSTVRKSSSPVERKRDSRSRTPKDKSPSPIRKSSLADSGPAGTKSTTTTTTTTARIFQTDLKKTKPVAKTVISEKPDWATQRTLRKVSETKAPTTKTVTTTTTKKISTKKESRDSSDADVITSGYGVGPTDENGSPLFGLKALRAQNKPEKTKVQGTVIRSHYHSENGGEPEGEISITKFSTDPSDLGTEHVSQEEGITSMTTTQKFGYKGTPSLKTISSKDKKTTESQSTTNTGKTSKVTRRGSVKEISQKFIENAVDTLKSERQSSYPKAGLILRTSSFKDSTDKETRSCRETSPETHEIHQKIVTTVKKTTADGRKGDTFLSNKSKITDVQDVISRMKNEEVMQVKETADDTEARNLLNKFIGSQVLLSGMESHIAKPIDEAVSGSVKRTTKITTTTTSSESSKPSTVTTTFIHPITSELLETVWDGQTLKLLLEQSTDYEDRRIIRARLREVMAEQEACAELVEKSSSEATMRESGSTVHETTRTYTEGPVTTTSQATTKTTSQQQVKKPMSPFAKFRQLDKQNSLNSPPSTPKSPNGGGPLFKFTDPSLNQSANTVKQRLLQWCQMKTKEYENIQLDNFSTSWADGMAFCALIHHFLPEAFDYKALNPRNRRHNFNLAFRVADEKAGIAPLLDVDDMVAISRPDWKCVFTYVQSIYRRFKDED